VTSDDVAGFADHAGHGLGGRQPALAHLSRIELRALQGGRARQVGLVLLPRFGVDDVQVSEKFRLLIEEESL
jgi:hypothetical protein